MIINPFEFRSVPSIQVAWGGARRLGELLSVRFPERRAQLITDSGLMKAGLVAPVAEALSRSGFSVTIFDRVVADPPEQIVTECVASAKESGTDIVIGLGGGSSLDIAKLVAILLVSDQALADMYGIGNVRACVCHLFWCRRQPEPARKLLTFRLLPLAKPRKWGWCRLSCMPTSFCSTRS